MSETSVRRVTVDLAQASLHRLERLKEKMDATGYAEVIRAALRSLEKDIDAQDAKTPLQNS